MENMTTKERYQFNCNRWLADNEDDKECVREMPAEGRLVIKKLPLKTYIVEVQTGKKSGAGTDADVFINIFGKYGDTGERYLKHSKTHSNKFERGNVDVFLIEAVQLKQLQKIRIGHNNKMPGSAWFLEKVTIKEENGNGKYDHEFECKRWLAVDEDDGQIVREFFVDGSQFLDSISYHLKIKTGDIRNAGTDANVYLKIFGEKGDSGKKKLKRSDTTTNKFERGRIDEFIIESDDLGKVNTIWINYHFSFNKIYELSFR
jgi:lipoxygenase homology domain-containing protein 1